MLLLKTDCREDPFNCRMLVKLNSMLYDLFTSTVISYQYNLNEGKQKQCETCSWFQL